MQHAFGVKNENLACDFHWKCTYCLKEDSEGFIAKRHEFTMYS